MKKIYCNPCTMESICFAYFILEHNLHCEQNQTLSSIVEDYKTFMARQTRRVDGKILLA